MGKTRVFSQDLPGWLAAGVKVTLARVHTHACFTTSLLLPMESKIPLVKVRYIVLGIPHSVRYAHSNRQNKENDEDWSIVSVANYAE